MILKRRKSKRTDYKARFAMLKSGIPRFVVRKHTNNIHIQIVSYEKTGDKTLFELCSSKMKNGWNGHAGNIPAAYLAGYETGLACLKAGIMHAVLDIGMQTSTKGNAVYAAAKGAVDAGLEMPLGDELVPDEGRIKGSHINGEIPKKFENALAKCKAMKGIV